MVDTALTKEAVAEARAQLIERDRKPSQRAIIKHLGRGSFSQVGPWLRELDAEENERAGSALVEPLNAAVGTATAELWRALGSEADRVVDEAQKEFEKRSQAAEGERDRAQASLERLRQELQVAQLLGETQRQTLETQRADLETQRAKLDDSRTAHATTTAAHAESRGRAEGLAALAAERQATLEQLQHERAEIRRARSDEREASAAELAALNDVHEQRLAERGQRIETLQRELSQSRLAIARLETSVERLDAQHREREAHQVEWQTRHQLLVEADAELQAQFAILKEAKSAVDHALATAGEIHAQRLADKDRLIDRLEWEVARLTDAGQEVKAASASSGSDQD